MNFPSPRLIVLPSLFYDFQKDGGKTDGSMPLLKVLARSKTLITHASFYLLVNIKEEKQGKCDKLIKNGNSLDIPLYIENNHIMSNSVYSLG